MATENELAGASFGRWLKYQLWRREMRQADFARVGGFTPSMVSYWARDDRMPDPESCARIAEILGLDVDEVLTRAGHRPAGYDEPDEATRALLGIMHRLTPAERQEVEAFARYRLERLLRQQRLGPGSSTAASPPPSMTEV